MVKVILSQTESMSSTCKRTSFSSTQYPTCNTISDSKYLNIQLYRFLHLQIFSLGQTLHVNISKYEIVIMLSCVVITAKKITVKITGKNNNVLITLRSFSSSMLRVKIIYRESESDNDITHVICAKR